MKRKLVLDSDDAVHNNTKHLKLIPFPNSYIDDDDVPMSDQPLYPEICHSRLSSNVSSDSNYPLDNSPAYPSFDLYPLPFFSPEGSVDTNSHTYSHYAAQSPAPMVGLLQPSSSFTHHGMNCSQIPKLRVACASGINGQRTMWSFCEQCGAISMVETD
jgi:hypothetical protein